MATYYIPTDYAGGTILVNDGDIFIFEAGASTDVVFDSATGGPVDFGIQFDESNANAVSITVNDGMNVDITIADNVSLDTVYIDARNAGSTDVTIGDNVTLERFDGSDGGTDTVTIGDNFTTFNDFRTLAGDDAITIGNNATAPNFDTGGDIDTVITDDPNITVSNAENIDVIGEGTTTYFIPNDFAGGTILVNEGDIYIFEAGAATNVSFESATGLPVEFGIQFNETNTNDFDVAVADDMHVDITIADDVSLDSLYIKATGAGSTNVTIGDNVTLETFDGSKIGTDTVTIGDNFTTFNDFKTQAGDDTVTVGTNFTGPKIDAGSDIDTVISLDPNVLIENAENVINPDGIVDGTGLDDTIGAGFIDPQTDEVDGSDGVDDTIIGYRGNDTIDGGAGNDIIYGDYAEEYVPPPDVAPGAEELTFVIDDAGVNSGVVQISLDAISADVSLANDVAITDTTTTPITQIDLAKLGQSDGEEDVLRFDLTTFDDDFLITVKSDSIEDKIILVGVETSTDNGDGTFSYTYIGSDGQEHTVTVNPNISQIEAYRAFLDASESSDIIDGGAGDDTIDGGFGDDQLTGGSGADTIFGGVGDDTISGGDEADILEGGAGDDTILGGEGNDTISGDDPEAAISAGRVGISWSDIPDPDDGGQIDDADAITTAVLSVGNVDVSINAPVSMNGAFEIDAQNVSGIDTGTDTINQNSAFDLNGSGSGVMTVEFSEPVENVAFRVNDFEGDPENLTIRMYDADGNLIPYDATLGSNVIGTDTDAVAGVDTFTGGPDSTSRPDTDPNNSLLIEAAGPVARIEFDWAPTANWSLAVSDIWFDDPTLANENTGNDNIDAGGGDDLIIASRGTDTIDGGTGTDTYDASKSGSLVDDTLSVTVDQTGSGSVAKARDGTTDTVTSVEEFIADEVEGQTDAITLTGNVDRNTISGLSDAAVGVFTAADGGAPIAFGGSGEPTINELLSGSYDPGTGIVQPKGTYQITSGEEDGAQVGTISFSNFEEANFTVVCYGLGSLIDTPDGPKPVEALRPGDLVTTLDDGPQPIKWARRATHSIGAGPVDDVPVLIRAGALGPGRPAADLIVSPQHRIFVGSCDQLAAAFEAEYFVPAKALTGLRGVRRMRGKRSIEWVHFALERHQLVEANGLWSESLLLGPMVLAGLTQDERASVFRIFGHPDTEIEALNGPPARPCLKAGQARRHLAKCPVSPEILVQANGASAALRKLSPIDGRKSGSSALSSRERPRASATDTRAFPNHA